MPVRNAKAPSGLMLFKTKLNILIILNQMCLIEEFTKVIIINNQVVFSLSFQPVFTFSVEMQCVCMHVCMYVLNFAVATELPQENA